MIYTNKIIIFAKNIQNIGNLLSNFRIVSASERLNYVIVKVDNEDPYEAIQKILKHDSVIDATFDLSGERNLTTLTPAPVTNDPDLNQLWGLKDMGVFEAHHLYGRGNPSIKIAMIDQGIDLEHEEFIGKTIYGYASPETETWTADTSGGHGNATSSQITAEGDNGKGIIGIVPDAVFYHLAATPGGANCLLSDILECIDFGLANGVRIFALSQNLGKTLEQTAIDSIKNQGAIFVTTSGNDGILLSSRTAVQECFFVIGNYDSSLAMSRSSVYGPLVDCNTPGTDILMAYKYNNTTGESSYITATGTSMACPYFAAAAALVWGINPLLSNYQVSRILNESRIPLPTFEGQERGPTGRLNTLLACHKAFITKPENADATIPFVWFDGEDVTREIIDGELVVSLSGQVSVMAEAVTNAPYYNLKFYVGDTCLFDGIKSSSRIFDNFSIDEVVCGTLEDYQSLSIARTGAWSVPFEISTATQVWFSMISSGGFVPGYITNGCAGYINIPSGAGPTSTQEGEIVIDFGEFDLTDKNTLVFPHYRGMLLAFFIELLIDDEVVWKYWEMGTTTFTSSVFNAIADISKYSGLHRVKFRGFHNTDPKYKATNLTKANLIFDNVYLSRDKCIEYDTMWDTSALQGDYRVEVTPLWGAFSKGKTESFFLKTIGNKVFSFIQKQ
jgi:hypothetical protein